MYCNLLCLCSLLTSIWVGPTAGLGSWLFGLLITSATSVSIAGLAGIDADFKGIGLLTTG